MLFRGEALRQFDFWSADVENIETLNVDYYIKGLALYFPLWIRSKKARDAPRNEKTAQSKIKTLCGALDWYEWIFGSLPGASLVDKIDATGLNEILLNRMPNSWLKKTMFKALIVNLFCLRNLLTFLSVWKSQNLFAKV